MNTILIHKPEPKSVPLAFPPMPLKQYKLTAKWQVVEGKLVRQWRLDSP